AAWAGRRGTGAGFLGAEVDGPSPKREGGTMTNDPRRRGRAALWHWQQIERQPSPEKACWAQALRQPAAYYHRHDPIRAGILEQRYRRHLTEEQVQAQLHIGRTTYQKANTDLLSTLAVYAAREGLL